MSNKDEFKIFVKSHPELIKYVNNKEKTWQDFYELYTLYGTNSNIWDEYKEKEETKKTDLNSLLKNINVEEVQKNIESINKGLALIESLITKESSPVNNYTPRPLYKKFED